MQTSYERLQLMDNEQFEKMRHAVRNEPIFDNVHTLSGIASYSRWLTQGISYAETVGGDYGISDMDVSKYCHGEESKNPVDLKHDASTGYLHLTVNMPSVHGWQRLETPVVSRIFPQAEVGRQINETSQTLSVYGPLDALGPNTIQYLRAFTAHAVSAFINDPLLVGNQLPSVFATK